MATIECFFLKPEPLARETLRRYRGRKEGEERCPGPFGYHDACAVIGESVEYTETDFNGRGTLAFARNDPRWPSHCACGYEFDSESDSWQHNLDRLYTGHPSGALYTLSYSPAYGGAPPGAMWDADWLGRNEYMRSRSPDGIILVVRTPDGDWEVDGKASNGPGWTRTGVPPKVTATPSILFPKYHGWLRDGFLVDA